MNKEKQIEEMKLIIDKAEEEYSEIWNEWFYDHKEGTKIDNEFLFFAKMLYDAGYRKASEVAREIFEEMEKDFLKRQDKYDKEAEKCGWHLEMRREYEGQSSGVEYCLDKIAELKKKYTEEGK